MSELLAGRIDTQLEKEIGAIGGQVFAELGEAATTHMLPVENRPRRPGEPAEVGEPAEPVRPDHFPYMPDPDEQEQEGPGEGSESE